MRGRYAPSPTGPMHAGNLRTALLAWLQARLCGAEFVVRMEDIDVPRTREGSATAIMEDLRWMGLDWDAGPTGLDEHDPYMQTARVQHYQAALEYLQERELVYPCWCTRREIQEASSAPHGKTSVYPGTCAHLSVEERKEVQELRPDRQPAWRYRVDGWTEPLSFVDAIQGEYTQDLVDEVGDFVVLRSDGLWAYQLAVVVDDLMMGITDVLRGFDLLDSTPRQIALSSVLSGFVREAGIDPQPITYWHVPLMNDESGERLAKRTAAEQVDRTQPPERFIGHLARSLGWDVPDMTATELLNQIDIQRIRELKEKT